MRVKNLFLIAFIYLATAFLVKTESFALAIQDSTLTSSQVASITHIRAVGLQTVGTVIVWNQAGNPADMINDDGRAVWLDCDGSTFDTGYYTALASIIPTGVLPNLKDQFLRGGNSGQVGQTALDTTRSHLHGIPPHSHTVSGTASSQNVAVGGQNVNGTAAGQQYWNSRTWIDDHGSTGYAGYLGLIPLGDGANGVTYVGAVNDYNTATSSPVTGVTSSNTFTTTGGTITGVTNVVSQSTNLTGQSETAPQHIRVRYLIRALP